MVKMISFQVEDALVKDIDRAIALGAFSSRSEFMKNYIRKGIEEQIEKENWRKNFELQTKK